MAHRQEEKERRRAERLAQEEAERRTAGRRQRLQLVVGVVLGVLVVAGIALAVSGVFSGGSDSGANPSKPASQSDLPKLPQQQVANLNAAAKAAGCKVSNPPIEGRQHETKDFKASDYKTNPPTSGNHNPVWYQDGIYEPGDVPKLGMIVHTLEHGRIDVQYKPGTPKATVDQLEAFMAEQSDGYHMLLFQNTTQMPYAVAAAAWGHLLVCPTMSPKVFDALRTFRARYIDKGPEQVP